jgi:long-chain acyl-CoA synthetase
MTALIYLDARAQSRDAVLERAARAASGLHALGVREGDAIAVLMRNDFAFIEATQAAAALGAYCVPINWHGKRDEVRYILDDVRPKVLVAHADLLGPLRGALPEGLQVLVAPTPPEACHAFGIDAAAAAPLAGERAWPGWLAGFARWDGPPMRTRATLIYTSGTTGHPKGVRREPATPEQAVDYAALMRAVYGVAPGIHALVGGPLYHSSPNAFLRQALMQAEVLVMQSRFDAEQTLAAIARHRITHAVMVPTMFVRLVKLPPEVRARHDLSSLRWVVHTGAPCAPEIKRAVMDWWGPIVYETYGGTEVGAVTLSTPQDWLAHPGSVGTLTPGARLAIYDEQGRVLPPGEAGEIYLRQPALADFTYLNNDAKRREVERDGLISVGDIGYLKDGRLYLCDRRSDMVISAGVNIYPAEIESVLVQCPGVRDCAVFGIPDAEFGESLCAAVERAPGADVSVEQIRAYLGERLAKYKVPARIEFHDALPREESGKIFKRRLRDPFWKDTGRRI